uniref:Integrase core domain containing protein n=1 Tax=Solanum tuberosum TaxID=4113 RepID=M1DPB8_SOLTU
MATMLHHVKPWMQKSITDSEARKGKRMETRKDIDAQPDPTRARGKRHCSNQNFDTTEEARVKKRERQWTEQARKASIIDEELHQQKVRESARGASSSVPVVEVQTIESHDVSTTDGSVRRIDSTTEGVVIADVGTTEGGLNVSLAGSEKPDPPTC